MTVLATATLIIGGVQRGPVQPTPAMKADVDRLVARAEKLERLWPWQSPIPDIERVVRHGKRVAPLLVKLLDDDPDDPAPEAPDWRVQQQAALALCRIFGVSEECGRIYCSRATREVNRGVKLRGGFPMGRWSLLKSLCLTAVVLGTLATPVAAQVIRIHKGVVVVPLFPPAEVDISGTRGFRVDGAGVGFGFNAITQCSEPGGCPPGAVVELDAEIAGSNFNGTVRLQGTTYVDVGSLSSRENLVLSFAGQATMPPMGGGPTTITAPFELTGEFVYTDDSEVHSLALTGEGIVTLFLEPSLDGTSWMITSAEFDFGPVRRRGSLVS